VAIEARLANLHQRESVLEVDQDVAVEHVEQQLPTFAKASQNVVAATTLLDTLPIPSALPPHSRRRAPNNIKSRSLF
jgi:hypothetical protein